LVRLFFGVILLAALAAVFVGLGKAEALKTRAFYLAVHPRQCLVVPTHGAGKMVLVVSCSDPAHNQEVYAIGHGGWGHHTAPAYATAYAVARSFCLSAFQRLTGHQMTRSEGWSASWPDSGVETTKYGDKIVCKFRAWPLMTPLGNGWHVR
jgi:hypothetical protein